jgi:hypothetical protein
MLPLALHRMHRRAKDPTTTVNERSGQDMQVVIGSYEACFRGDSAICTCQTMQSTARFGSFSLWNTELHLL